MAKRRSKFWFKNEKELMNSLGMKGTPGSGNRIVKEDGQNEHLIAQLKSTDGSSVTIKLEDVNKLLYNSTVAHKLPLFISQFINGPILVSVRLEDLIDIAEYLVTGAYDGKRFQDIEQITEQAQQVQFPMIKSGGREAVKAKIAKEKEKELEERKRKK